MLIESQVMFRRPQNISGAAQQNYRISQGFKNNQTSDGSIQLVCCNPVLAGTSSEAGALA